MDNVVDENYKTMCRVWLKQVELSNPDEIIVMYNKNPPDFLNDYPKVKTVFCEYDSNFLKPDIESDEQTRLSHFFVAFKLFIKFKINGPFIYLDADAIPVTKLNELWNLRNEKPLIGVGYQNLFHYPQFFKKLGVGNNPNNILNGGVILVNDLSFINRDRLIEIYFDYIKSNNFLGFIADDILLTLYFNEIGYDFKHPNVDMGWNCCSDTIFKIKENRGEIEIISRDDEYKFAKVKILHFYGQSRKPWVKSNNYYKYLLKKYNL